MHKEELYTLVKETTAPDSNLVVPRLFAQVFGLETAVFLSQLMQWDNGGPVSVSQKGWREATYLTEYSIRKARQVLREKGVIAEVIKKLDGPYSLVHISLDREMLVDVLCRHLGIETDDRRDVPAKTPRPTLDTLQSSSLPLSSPSETQEVPAARETAPEPDPPPLVTVEQTKELVTAPGRPHVIVHARRKTSANEAMAHALCLAFRYPPKPSQNVMGRMRRLAKQVLGNEYTEEMVKEVGVSWWGTWPGIEGSQPSDDQFLQRLEQHRIGAEKWRKA